MDISTAAPTVAEVTDDAATATVEIVIPVYNEEHVLEANVRRLRSYLDERFPFSALVTIADNASTDGTWAVASRLATSVSGVAALHLEEKGRGRALRAAWTASRAAVVAYMDVDLATDLDGLLPLVAPLLSGHSDIAIGSRLARGSRVQRGCKREIISRLYNALVRTTVGSSFTDAQCGFKAVRRDAVHSLLPLVADQGWFFDTELLILGEVNGMRIHEVPVDWVDDADSRVHIVSTAATDLRGLARMASQLARGHGRAPELRPSLDPRHVSRFGGIGGLSTLLYLTLLLSCATPLGVLSANAAALSVAASVNGAAHAQLTMPRRQDAQRRDRAAFLFESCASFAVHLILSSLALTAVTQVTSDVAAIGLTALAVNVLVSAARFVSFRARMFRRTTSPGRER